MKLLLTTCLTITGFIIGAQNNLSFGSWESHLSYQQGLAITQSPNKIYYATDRSIMSVDKEDLSLDFISKVDGLSDLGISNIYFDKASGSIMVVYEDSNLDIIREDGIINIADIKNNTGISGDKRVNDVHFDGAGNAFLSTGFGVVRFNMNNLEFGFTTQMRMQVNATTTDGQNQLYAATEDGIYRLDLGANFNFGDFANWELLENQNGLPLAYSARDIACFGNEVFALIDGKVYKSEEGFFNVFLEREAGEQFLFLNTSGDELLIGARKPSSFSSRVYFVDSTFTVDIGTSTCANFIRDALVDETGRVWYADEWNNFRYTQGKEGNCQRFTAPSPYAHDVSELRVKDGTLFVASGGVTEGFNFLSNRNGVYTFSEGQWMNYNEGNYPPMKSADMVNSFVIAPHPLNDDVFIGSFYSGLLQVNFNTGTYTHFNGTNSPILGPQGSPEIEKVSGLAFDSRNNLWISVYEADKPLIALTPDGNFHAFEVPASTRIGQIAIDDNDYLWIQVTGASGGVLIYDYNGTVNDPSDDRIRFINSSNTRIKNNQINCIEKDRDGDVWLGTANGPVIFECGNPFDAENCLGSIRTVLEDSIPAELLVTEDVRTISFDGANRVWIGSRNGIFVQSPNGIDKVDRFTTDNSPLFDNNIIDMAFDGQSGVMYIASNGGIQAYKTTTTEPTRFHSNVYAFPNPVRPEFDGLIGIRGLARNAEVKITDINGQLVHQTEALGGQAVWNGRDYNGRKVSSGVYLVFSNSRDVFEDPNTAVAKILIIR